MPGGAAETLGSLLVPAVAVAAVVGALLAPWDAGAWDAGAWDAGAWDVGALLGAVVAGDPLEQAEIKSTAVTAMPDRLCHLGR